MYTTKINSQGKQTRLQGDGDGDRCALSLKRPKYLAKYVTGVFLQELVVLVFKQSNFSTFLTLEEHTLQIFLGRADDKILVRSCSSCLAKKYILETKEVFL